LKDAAGKKDTFVGRKADIDRLEKAMEEAESSKGSFYLIAGEVAIGKTALANKIAEIATGREWIVMSGNCMFGEGEEPYQPFVKAIQRYIEEQVLREDLGKGAVDDLSRTSLPMGFIGIAPEKKGQRRKAKPMTDFTTERDRMFDTVSSYLVTTSKKAPVLFFLDDLHWADSATLHLLYYLIRSLGECRIILLGAYRPEEVEGVGTKHPFNDFLHRLKREKLGRSITLSGFHKEDTAELVKAITGAELPSKVVDDIHTETVGNPFFIEEFVKKLIEQGIVVEGEGIKGPFDLDHISIPSTISGLIMGRIRELDEEEKKILEYGSVIGQEFRYDLLIESSGVDEGHAVDALEKLMDLSILDETEQAGEVYYRFSNNLMYEVVYNNLSRAKRRLMHKKVGTAIEGLGAGAGVTYALAYHFQMAGEMIKALDYSIRAGETAMAMFASDEAMEYFRKSLDMIEKVDGVRDAIAKETRLLLSMGQIATIQGDWRSGLRYFYEAIRLCETDSKEKAMAHREIGKIETNRTDWRIAIESLNEALRISEKIEDVKGIAEALGDLSYVHWRLGNHQKTQEFGQEALKHAEKIRDRRLMANILINMGNSFNEILLDYDKSLEFYNKARDILDHERDIDLLSRVLNNTGDIQMNIGKYDEAIENFENVLEIVVKTGDLSSKGYAVFNIGECLVKMGKHEEAIPYLRDARKIFEKLDNRSMISMCHVYKGIVARESERWDEAENFFKLAMRVQEELDLMWGLGTTCLEYGKMLKARGDNKRAREMLEKSIDIFQDIDSPKNIEIAGRELDQIN
jgi:tetratricopeptide (TPR) repeat protein